MGSLSSSKRGVKHFLYVIDVLIKDKWIKFLKDRKVKTVLHGFIEIVKESKRHPNKL